MAIREAESKTMKQQKCVVFGAGPLGLSVARIASVYYQSVLLINRSGRVDCNLPDNVILKVANAADPGHVHHLCKGARVVFHCAVPAYTDWPSEFPALMKGIMQGTRLAGAKLVYGDNLYSYGDKNGAELTENIEPSPKGAKCKVRHQLASELLQAHRQGDLEVVIGRSSDFFGPGVRQSALGQAFFGNIAKGKTAYLLGDLDLLHTLCYIEDFAKALVRLSREDRAVGEIWHVPSAETITLRRFCELTEQVLGRRIKVRTASTGLVGMLALFNPMMRETKEMMFSWTKPYVVNTSKYVAAFGREVTGHEQAIEKTLRWYQSKT